MQTRERRLTLAGAWASIKMCFFKKQCWLPMLMSSLSPPTFNHSLFTSFITAPINSVPPQLKNGRRDQETAIFSGCHQAVKLFHVIRRDIRFDNLGQFSSAFTQISPNATNFVFAFHGFKNQEAIAALKLTRLVAFLPKGSCGMTESVDHTTGYNHTISFNIL